MHVHPPEFCSSATSSFHCHGPELHHPRIRAPLPRYLRHGHPGDARLEAGLLALHDCRLLRVLQEPGRLRHAQDHLLARLAVLAGAQRLVDAVVTLLHAGERVRLGQESIVRVTGQILRPGQGLEWLNSDWSGGHKQSENPSNTLLELGMNYFCFAWDN